jgi:glycosyltransferase involved in cell wall biosynthesis
MEFESNAPLVSVIMPIYNGERYLAASLASAEAQTYPHFEIVVINDGSTDACGEIAQTFPHVRYWEQENQGIAAARNRAVSLARGELLAFLDDDDLWAPNKLELQVNYLKTHPEVSLVICNERLFFSDGFTSPIWLNHRLMQSDHPGLVPGTWLLKKDIFLAVGELNPRFRISDDVDWFLRFRDAGFQYGIVKETLLFKRLHGGNASFQVEMAVDEILTSFRESIHRRRLNGTRAGGT